MEALTPVFSPRLPSLKHVTPFLRSLDESRIYSNFGPLYYQYRELLANHFDVDPGRIVLVSSATQGIQGLVRILNLRKWRVPDFSFAAPGLAVITAGLELELVDVDSETWLSSGASSGGDVGNLVVLPFGRKIGTTTLEKQADTVIDAAASMGAAELGVDWLHETSAICFSLHATKVLGVGEGGAVVCGNEEMATALSSWTNFGFTNRVSLFPGTNAKFSEIHAAYGLAAMKLVDQELSEWRDLRREVRRLTSDLNLPTSIHDDPHFYDINPYWLLQLPSASVLDSVSKALRMAGFDSRKWWPVPLSAMPSFFANSGEINKNSTSLAGRVLGLPFYRGLKPTQLERVAQIATEALQR